MAHFQSDVDGVALTQEDLDGMLRYLRVHVDIRLRNQKKLHWPDEYHYVCMEDFVLDAGRPFMTISPDQPTTDSRGRENFIGVNRYRVRALKNCFHNSRCAASASRGKLRYVEGFAYTSFLPVHHAWNIDEHDRVVDTTWAGYEGDPTHRPLCGKAYYGVEFPLDFVRATSTHDNTSMIDRWEDGWPLLRTKWPKPEQVAA